MLVLVVVVVRTDVVVEVAKVGVKMTYDIPRLGVQDRGLEVILYAAG